MALMFVLYAVLLFLFIYWLMVKWSNRRFDYHLKNVPGPKPLFFIGNMLDFLGGSKTALRVMSGYLDQYGDTILVHSGPRERLLVSVDYQFVEQILNSSVHIDKSEEYDEFRSWLGLGLLTSSGTKWRKHRKMITPSFHFSILQKYVTIFHSVGNTLIERLDQEVGKPSVEISQIISLYALDVICEAAMGVKIHALSENSEYVKCIKLVCEWFADKNNLPLPEFFYMLMPKHWQERKALKHIHSFVENVIEKRREELEYDNDINELDDGIEGGKRRLAFLDLLLKSTIDGRPLTKREIRDEVNTFMFEGHDTTATVMSFCLYMLSLHPKYQEKVYNEQVSLFGDKLDNVTPTYSELSEMKYLDLVIKETLRLFPPVPIMGRKLGKDIEYNGTLYPKGLNVMIYPFDYHRRSKYFSDPEKFIPERFETQGGRLPFSYIPFSAGPRNCIGQKFAMLEMLSTISNIVRNFELVKAIPEHNIVLAPEVILISKTGIRLGLKRRT